MLFFFEIMQLLVEETNGYHQYLVTLDKGRSPLPDVTVQEMSLFLTIIVRMRHEITAQHRYSTSRPFT